MVYKLARGLQLLGMILIPIGVAGNLARPEEVTLSRSLVISSVGIGFFALGWLLQQSTRPQ